MYDGGGPRQEALGQAGRSLSKRVLPPAVGMEADGLSFFYAGREHAAIAPMREKYTAMYPATAPNGAVGIRCPRCQNRIGQLGSGAEFKGHVEARQPSATTHAREIVNGRGALRDQTK